MSVKTSHSDPGIEGDSPSNPAIPTPGIEGNSPSNPAIPTPGIEGDSPSNPAIPAPGPSSRNLKSGRQSHEVGGFVNTKKPRPQNLWVNNKALPFSFGMIVFAITINHLENEQCLSRLY